VLGNVARRLWYRDWRHEVRVARTSFGAASKSGFIRQVHTAVEQGKLFSYRAAYVLKYYWPRLRVGALWLLTSRETSNFTYDLTPRNEQHLAQLIALAVGCPPSQIIGYFDEIRQDRALGDAIAGQVKVLGRQGGYDPVARFGRRIGWYALVRATKPKVVIETGVEKGMGAMVLCAALLRNSREGYQGRYYGTDINRGAGRLFVEPYLSKGEILYGDSIETLSALDEVVDIFINDSDHSADYEREEYRIIACKLAERAIIVGDNAHVTDELLKFSSETGRKFLFFREEPANHWYLGAGIGLAFKSSRP
jgi:Methyltransferase domain